MLKIQLYFIFFSYFLLKTQLQTSIQKKVGENNTCIFLIVKSKEVFKKKGGSIETRRIIIAHFPAVI